MDLFGIAEPLSRVPHHCGCKSIVETGGDLTNQPATLIGLEIMH